MTNRKYQDGDIHLYANDLPICTYCGTEQEDDEHILETSPCHDDIIETECEECEESFNVRFGIGVTYTSCADRF